MDDTNQGDSELTSKRRTFIQWATSIFLSLWGVGLIAALASYLKPPTAPRSSGRESVSTGLLVDTVARGSAQLIPHGSTPLYVVRLQNGEFVAVSALCTHYQCVLKWDQGNAVFTCPCHDGSFSPVGEVMSGLPRKALQSYPVEVRRGEIQVRL